MEPELILPDFGLVLLFGRDAAAFAARLPGGLSGLSTGPQGSDGAHLAEQLAARQLITVDASHATRAELTALARIAGDAFAPVAAVALGTDAADMERRLGAIASNRRHAASPDSTVSFEPVATDRRRECGPFDIIGDVHGCADELVELLGGLGYRVTLGGEGDERRARVTAPSGRRAFFVGDLTDRGPANADALRIVMAMVADGTALCVAGNHDIGLLRALDGRATSYRHGLEKTMAELDQATPRWRADVKAFLEGLESHLWVDGGRLAVAHAGVMEDMIGRIGGKVRSFALYGDTESKTAADGLPVRYHWALRYAGPVTVVYGHTPLADVGFVNNTLCIDTGCCFGGP